MRDHLSERLDTPVAEWAKCWDHWGYLGALSYRFIGNEMDLSFVRCQKEVNNDRRLVHSLKWMSYQEDCLANRPSSAVSRAMVLRLSCVLGAQLRY